MKALVAWYRLLQRLVLPPSFRQLYGGEMGLVYEARVRQRQSEQGRVAAWKTSLVEGFDLVLTAAREWWYMMRSRRRTAVTGSQSRGALGAIQWRGGDGPLRSFPSEIRQILRGWARRPGFVAATVLTLSLAIGANTAVFSVVDAVLIRPLPFREPDRLVMPEHTAPGQGVGELANTDALYFLYSEHSRVFEEFGVFLPRAVNLTGGDEPERISALYATHEVLAALGVTPELGRTITREDDQPGAPPVVVLSHELWERRFGGDPSVVGRTIQMDGTTREVVGVLPREFHFPTATAEVYAPFRFDPGHVAAGDYNYSGIARLKEGVTLAEAERDMNRVIFLLPDAYGVSREFLERAQLGARIIPLREAVAGDVGSVLWTLMGTVAFVFLIACANVANLCLVRALGRRREVGMRMALGAGRGHLARYFLIESLVLGLVAGFTGLVLAYAGVRGLVASSPVGIPRLEEIGIDASAALFALGISLLAVLLLGLFPLTFSRSPDLVGALKDGIRRAENGGRSYRVQDLLAVTQMALALVLLVGASLMIRTVRELRAVDPGFDDPQSVLTFRVALPVEKYVNDDFRAVSGFQQALVDRIRELPGVVSVGAVTTVPMAGGLPGMGTWFEDFPLEPDEPPEVLRSAWVTEGYFEAMGIEVVEGRIIDRFDHIDRTGAAVINQSLARRLWDDRSPLGSGLRPSSTGEFYTVVGVVEDVHQGGVDQPPTDIVYYPMIGVGSDTARFAYMSRSMNYAVRSEGAPLALVPAVREAAWSIDPELPVAQVRSMDEVLSTSMARTSFCMLLLGIAATMALVLGAIGLYGVVSYVVAQRTREMGVRIALGAGKWELIRLVVGRGFGLAMAGAVLGLAGAVLLTRLMRALLFGVSPSDPATLAGAAVMLTGVALLASYLPAWRAASVDPVRALAVE